MTRGMFFRVLAALGLGQQGTRIPSGWGEMPKADMCVQVRDGKYWNVPCSPDPRYMELCKEGEEYCPLGHCQVPSTINRFHSNEGRLFEEHVCSRCGIVYVPMRKEAPDGHDGK